MTGTSQITEFCYMKIDYEDSTTCVLATDKLHCSSDYYHEPHHDSILVNMTGSDFIPCKLVRIFTYMVEGENYALALVQPRTAISDFSLAVDHDLSLYCVRTRPRSESVVIPVCSIICATVLVEDISKSEDYLILDTLSSDTFLRMIDIFPNPCTY